MCVNTAERIVQIRKEHRYSRREVAAELNIPYATLTKYENGTRNPPYSFLFAFAKKFGVTVEYLAGYSDTQAASPFGNGIYGHIALDKSISELLDNVGYRIYGNPASKRIYLNRTSTPNGTARIYKDEADALHFAISEFARNAASVLFSYAIARETAEIEEENNSFSDFIDKLQHGDNTDK